MYNICTLWENVIFICTCTLLENVIFVHVQSIQTGRKGSL